MLSRCHELLLRWQLIKINISREACVFKLPSVHGIKMVILNDPKWFKITANTNRIRSIWHDWYYHYQQHRLLLMFTGVLIRLNYMFHWTSRTRSIPTTSQKSLSYWPMPFGGGAIYWLKLMKISNWELLKCGTERVRRTPHHNQVPIHKWSSTCRFLLKTIFMKSVEMSISIRKMLLCVLV